VHQAAAKCLKAQSMSCNGGHVAAASIGMIAGLNKQKCCDELLILKNMHPWQHETPATTQASQAAQFCVSCCNTHTSGHDNSAVFNMNKVVNKATT